MLLLAPSGLAVPASRRLFQLCVCFACVIHGRFGLVPSVLPDVFFSCAFFAGVIHICLASSVSAVFVLLTYYTVALPGGKNIDRQIPLHTPFTFFIRCRPTSAPVCVSHLIGRVFTSFGLCSHCLFLNGVHLVWAPVVVDVITLMHVRFVWAALIVRHMGLSDSGPLGFGWLLFSGSAYYV